MSWLTLNEFKSLTGITVDDAIITEALNSSATEIIRKIFVSRRYQSYEGKTRHDLNYPIADTFADGILDYKDVIAWQEDINTKEEVMINTSDITIVTNGMQRAYIEFTTDYPEAGKALFIDYKLSKNDISNMIIELKELQKHLGIVYVFTNTPYSQLQSGISSWSLNGVSVTFDQNAMIAAKDEAMKQVKRLYQALRPVRADGLAIGSMYHNRIAASKYAGNRFIW